AWGSRPSSIASAMCASNSSSISRLTRPARSELVNFESHDISSHPEDAIDGGGDGLPSGFFLLQLGAAGSRDFVDSGAAAVFFRDPLGTDPPGLLHAMQRGVERALFDTQNVAGPFLDRGHDRVAVQAGAAHDNFERQQIERALERIRFRHT